VPTLGAPSRATLCETYQTQGGEVIFGAFPVVGNSYDNEANVQMLGTKFISDNGQPENMTTSGDRRDMLALGARGFFGIEEVIGNKVSLLLRGAISNGSPSFIIVDNDPDNEMEIIGSETAIENAREGVDLLIFE
jgi:hypothetical protein